MIVIKLFAFLLAFAALMRLLAKFFEWLSRQPFGYTANAEPMTKEKP